MKALTPKELIEKIFHNKELFLGARISICLSSGHSFCGDLLGLGQNRDGLVAVMKLFQTGDHQWVSLQGFEAIGIQSLSPEQLAILTESEFDALKGQPEPGKLDVARLLQGLESRLKELINKNIKVVFSENQIAMSGHDRALQLNVLRSVMGQLSIIIERNFSDDFAKGELREKVDRFELRPSERAAVTLNGKAMEIHCPWQTPADRWTEIGLEKAINACF